ncbi:hypothetical protein F2Q69_00061879 [Brassica cretica]|uniref:Uncharacterized protein n=1 Tax=Brassica cretica TaxID=69181 RepID=A0A8S9RB52_BRACR|nr:hypothetical protein F2Q69_00061879 [Brassica cretica]
MDGEIHGEIEGENRRRDGLEIHGEIEGDSDGDSYAERCLIGLKSPSREREGRG